MSKSACIPPPERPRRTGVCAARGFRQSLLSCLLLWVGLVCGGVEGRARAEDGGQVAILYNTRSPRSREVAEFYGKARGVPPDQWIGLDCSSETLITRAAFEKEIAGPLRRILAERNLARLDAVRPAMAEGTRVRYLVPVFGMPYRILHDPNLKEDGTFGIQDNLRNNGASLDSDLMLLAKRPPVVATGPFQNPFYGFTNASLIRPENGLFLVSRLDGPTPELAMGLVTKALEAERDGLWGRAYFDLRGLNDGPYKMGDDWLKGAVAVARVLGFETEVDTAEATLGPGFPLSDVAIYGGWYDFTVSGPFTQPTVDFRPGAIAYHIHSYSAQDPRSTTANWVGPLVSRGATVTLGCVDEPYLQLSPNFGSFLACLASGMNIAEAGVVCMQVLSWQTLVIGDPMYRPFVPDLLTRSKAIEARGGPLVPWTVLQRINFHLNNGGDAGRTLADLETLPLSATNAVLAEKVASLYAAKSRLKQAIAWGQKSLAAGGSVPGRARLLREIAAWQQTLDKPADAAATLRQFVAEFPKHPDLLAVRRLQLEFARDLDQAAEVEALEAEIARLSAAAAASKPAGP